MEIKSLADLFLALKNRSKSRIVVVNAIDDHSLEAINEAVKLNIVTPILTGDKKIINKACERLNIDVSLFEIIDSPDNHAEMAMQIIHNGEADFIMKGLINTDDFMRIILNKEIGILPKGNLLTHIAIIENKQYHKLMIVSDVAIIPYPSLEQKEIMLEYLIEVANYLGIEKPKVAIIAPTEKVTSVIPACVDAAELVKKAESGRYQGAFVEGPMALDVAIDLESAQIKKIKSAIAGDADCLLFPNIDAGNVFYKMSTKLCNSEQAAVVMGTKVPAVLSSRGDSIQTKLNSIALAALMCK